MYKYFTVLIILFASGLQAKDPASHPNARLLPAACGVSNDKYTSENPTAGLYEFPWMALISYRTRSGVDFQCSGTVINSRYILTAANCVENKAIAGVRVGEHNICTSIDCQGPGHASECESHVQDIHVEETKIHEDYVSKHPHINNNIALLHLKDPIDFSFKNVAPICLPISNDLRSISAEGKTATLASWTFSKPQTSCLLYKIFLPVPTRNECLQKLETSSGKDRIILSPQQLCADEQAQEACGIVSGDPLMLESEHEGGRRVVQYGFASHGPRRCGTNIPGIYTDVSKYMDWILNNIKE